MREDIEPKAMSADEMRERASAWIGRNPEAWERMKGMALERASKSKRFSIAELAEEARYRMKVQGDDAGFKVNNSLRAELARKLIREVPECEPHIAIRKSKVDRA